MKKVGLYFGTFNPIHNGHLILANYIVENTDLDEIWFVVTPQNPHKKKATILNNHHRFEMVYRATEPYPKLKPSNFEFDLPTPSYTVDSLVYLEEKKPNNEYVLLLGKDNLATFHKWKNHEVILERYSLYIYPRKTEKSTPPHLINHPKIKLLDAPEIELSSVSIRKAIKQNQNISPMIPYEAWKYLEEMNFYK